MITYLTLSSLPLPSPHSFQIYDADSFAPARFFLPRKVEPDNSSSNMVGGKAVRKCGEGKAAMRMDEVKMSAPPSAHENFS